MVVLLFEGVQGVGKSTLLDALEKAHRLVNARLPRPQSVKSDTYIGINQFNTLVAKKTILDLANVLNSTSSHKSCFAVDRYIASEYAFGHVCKRKQDYNWLMLIDRELADNGNVYTIYVTAPKQFVNDHIWARRGQYTAELIVAQLDTALKYFEEYLSLSKIPVIRFANDPQTSIRHNAAALWTLIEKELRLLSW
jgi:thymidylate kinase